MCVNVGKSLKYNVLTNDDYFGFFIPRHTPNVSWDGEWSEHFHVFTKMNKIFFHIFVLLNLIFWRITRSDMQSFPLALAIFACFIKQFQLGKGGRARVSPTTVTIFSNMYILQFSPPHPARLVQYNFNPSFHIANRCSSWQLLSE